MSSEKTELAMKVDAAAAALVENYKILLKRSQILEESVQKHEQLQLITASENIVRKYTVQLCQLY